MPDPQVSRETIKELVLMAGLELSDRRLEELLTNVQRTEEARAEIDRLDLEDVPPAFVFAPDED